MYIDMLFLIITCFYKILWYYMHCNLCVKPQVSHISSRCTLLCCMIEILWTYIHLWLILNIMCVFTLHNICTFIWILFVPSLLNVYCTETLQIYHPSQFIHTFINDLNSWIITDSNFSVAKHSKLINITLAEILMTHYSFWWYNYDLSNRILIFNEKLWWYVWQWCIVSTAHVLLHMLNYCFTFLKHTDIFARTYPICNYCTYL